MVILSDANIVGKSDLDELAERISASHRLAVQSAATALEHARDCGLLLLEAKGKCEHGQWSVWLRDNCQFSARSARAYVFIARHWDKIEARAKRQRVADMSIREALRLTSEPKPPALPDLDALRAGQKFCAVGKNDDVAFLDPSAEHSGYVHFRHYCNLSTDYATEVFTKRPLLIRDDVLVALMEATGFVPAQEWISDREATAEQ